MKSENLSLCSEGRSRLSQVLRARVAALSWTSDLCRPCLAGKLGSDGNAWETDEARRGMTVCLPAGRRGRAGVYRVREEPGSLNIPLSCPSFGREYATFFFRGICQDAPSVPSEDDGKLRVAADNI